MDDVVRYGIIGTGMMGIEHLWNLHHVDGAQVTALADPSERSLGWALEADEKGADGTRQRTGPAPVTFADHRDLLASGLVDAVVVASPNMTHHDVLVDVLDAGVHVLVEKPLCTTVADCRDVIERAADHPGVVWVGLEYRYMPPVARLITEVHGGAVGRARMIAIREHRFPFLRKVHHWNRFNANTGGTLVEKCCHFFDLMNHLAQATPVRVMASGAQDVNHLDESYPEGVPDILDNAFVIVDYHDGTRALLDLCMFAEGTTNQEELSVVGDTGKVEAFLPSSILRSGRRSRGTPGVVETVAHDADVRYEGFHHGSSYLEHVDFLAAVRTGAAPGVSLAQGLMSVAMGVAAHRSIDEGRVVTMEEVLTDP
jgi:predicted dehydrogenase